MSINTRKTYKTLRVVLISLAFFLMASQSILAATFHKKYDVFLNSQKLAVMERKYDGGGWNLEFTDIIPESIPPECPANSGFLGHILGLKDLPGNGEVYLKFRIVDQKGQESVTIDKGRRTKDTYSSQPTYFNLSKSARQLGLGESPQSIELIFGKVSEDNLTRTVKAPNPTKTPIHVFNTLEISKNDESTPPSQYEQTYLPTENTVTQIITEAGKQACTFQYMIKAGIEAITIIYPKNGARLEFLAVKSEQTTQ